MVREVEEFLRAILNEYKEDLDGQPPNESQYLERVRREASGVGTPLCRLPLTTIDELARKVFRSIEILEIEHSEISTKARDAEANLNNRRYVDGSF